MFIGHYGIALALKGADRSLPLGTLFLAVQFVDLLWALFVLVGIERFQIVPGATAANPFDFTFYPISHSLLAACLWALVAYAGVRFLPGLSASDVPRAALVLALAVFSHFLLDVLVHGPDLPLAGSQSAKIGLGLWNHVVISYLLEAGLVVGGLWIYLKYTRPQSSVGKYGMGMFVICLMIANLAAYRQDMLEVLVPLPHTPRVLASFLLIYLLLFTWVARQLDQKRV